MKIKFIKKFFEGYEATPCPLTDRLIQSGYQQTGGGYIARAKRLRLVVDCAKAEPNQYWHLMSYCDSVDPEKRFSKSIVCGELIFWMAEVSSAVDERTLDDLLHRIILSRDENGSYNRRRWNKEIQAQCFDAIMNVVLAKTKKPHNCL